MSEAILAKYLRDIASVLGDIRNSLSPIKTDVDWYAVQKSVVGGAAVSEYPIGTQFVVEHKSEYGNQIYEVVGHNVFSAASGTSTMTLMAQQAYINEAFGTQNGILNGTLTQGDYYFYLNEQLDAWEKGYYKFTQYYEGDTGLFFLADEYGNALQSTTSLNGARIALLKKNGSEYEKCNLGITIQYYGQTAPSNAQNIFSGAFGEYPKSFDTVRRGCSNYTTSEIRQFLNGATRQWKPMSNSLSLPPTWDTTNGVDSFYMSLPDSLVSVLTPMEIKCENNTNNSNVSAGHTYQPDMVTIATQKQIFGINEGDFDDETTQFPLYKENIASLLKIKYNSGVKTNWCTRTPRYAATVYSVSREGTDAFASCSSKIGFAPIITIGGTV